MTDNLTGRRADAARRLDQLRSKLVESKNLATGKACVYATGSFARGEATKHSDLDLFIVGKTFVVDKTPESKGRHERALKRLDEICIKAELIRSTRELGISDFSGDGEYLQHYTIHDLTRSLGSPEDDATNTFTARLLLLLESSALVEAAVYDEAVSEVVYAYWRDFENHSKDFIPAFLANDIVRLWRTFCVNYEARTEKQPAEKNAKRKLKNYKLKHSRMLTCYSALLNLLSIHSRNATVTPKDAIEMAKRSPTARLEWLKEHHAGLTEKVDAVLNRYADFLAQTDDTEENLVARFLDPGSAKLLTSTSYQFGNRLFELLEALGTNGSSKSQFYRLLVV